MPNGNFPSVEPSFLVPTVLPMTVDPDDGYPFRDFFGRTDQTRVLRRWLMGSDQVGPEAQPRGGAVLVTGFRGVGKTALVNKLLFDVGTAALYGLELDSERADWGPFELGPLKRVLSRGPKKSFNPVLLIPIRVEVANALDSRSLLNRIVRRTYFALTRHEIGNARPDVMRRMRLAYVRTLGDLSSETSRKLSGRVGLTLDQIGKLEVTASQEYEFAETLHLAASELSPEEAEEELLDLGSALSDTRVGNSPSVGRLAVEAIKKGWRRGLERLNAVFRSHEGLRVHLVYVFDELDKLEEREAEQREADPLEVEVAWGSPGGRTTLRGRADLPGSGRASRPSNGSLRTALEVIGKLKLLLTAEEVSAVAIGGAGLEEAWQNERTGDDPILGSIFGRHVYVPQVDLPAAKKFLAHGTVGDLDADQTARALCYLSRGRYKTMIRLVYRLQQIQESGDAFGLTELHWAAELAGEWGLTKPRWGGVEADLDVLIAPCDDIESLTDAITRVGFVGRYTNEYGLDAIRSLLVCMTNELADYELLTSTGAFEKWLENVVDQVPARTQRTVVESAIRRLRALLSPLLVSS